MQISVMLGNYRLPFAEALETANAQGIPAVQLSIARSDDAVARAAMARAVEASGLAVSGVSVDFGDWGNAGAEAANIEAAKPLIDMTREFGTAICQTHIGIMPYDCAGARWDTFRRVASVLVPYAEAAGVAIALETGPEPASVMEAMMKEVGSRSFGVNYDPANFILWPAVLAKHPDLQKDTGRTYGAYDREAALAEFEPVEGVKRLAPYIVHTHAKDAIGDGGWTDVPLGTGWIDWPRYLQLLQDNGYDGYLAIEREGGEARVEEIGAAAEFLRGQLERLGRVG